MTCKNYKKVGKHALVEVRQEKFIQLPKDQRTLLNDWFEMTWRIREADPQRHYFGFLQAWELLAVIAEVLTGTSAVDDWYPALLHDAYPGGVFNAVMENKKSLMRMYVKRLAQVLPVFSVAAVGEGVSSAVRGEVVAAYLGRNIDDYAPRCWQDHQNDPEFLPDWQHTLDAWHMVRKNLLLAGNGWSNSELDVRIASNAFLSLIYFFKEGKLFFENPSLRPDIFERTQVLSSL